MNHSFNQSTHDFLRTTRPHANPIHPNSICFLLPNYTNRFAACIKHIVDKQKTVRLSSQYMHSFVWERNECLHAFLGGFIVSGTAPLLPICFTTAISTVVIFTIVLCRRSQTIDRCLFRFVGVSLLSDIVPSLRFVFLTPPPV